MTMFKIYIPIHSNNSPINSGILDIQFDYKYMNKDRFYIHLSRYINLNDWNNIITVMGNNTIDTFLKNLPSGRS